MRLLDLTLECPESNLALDEALLLDTADSCGALRLWESPVHLVVMGRGSKRDVEIRDDACRRDAIPVIRRCSGGASIVTGPGCLMYAVVMRFSSPNVDAIHRWVMDNMVAALTGSECPVERAGISDLVLLRTGRKFSGNSLRLRQAGGTRVLYHGTILYDYPLANIGRYLGQPPRVPEYRGERTHQEFVTNLPLTADQIRDRLIRQWNVDRTSSTDWPRAEVERLVEAKYSQAAWNARH